MDLVDSSENKLLICIFLIKKTYFFEANFL